METIKTDKDLIRKYNYICKRHLRAMSTLADLTDNELSIYIAGQTYRYGRPLDKALENGVTHLKDRQNAIKCFSRAKQADLLGFAA